MRIAFTSCMSTRSLTVQPVWSQIASKNPDALVLLGDAIYMDVPGQVPESDNDFARLMCQLYQRQLDVPEFDGLLKYLRAEHRLGTHAIWDDHDFLWNDADSQRALKPDAIGRALYSAIHFRLWCQALATGAPMPTPGSAATQAGYASPCTEADYRRVQPGYRSVLLEKNGDPPVVLHLTDGRSWRKGESLLGAEQWLQIEAKLEAFPDATHLLASGSTCQKVKGLLGGFKDRNSWANFPADLGRLRRNAAKYKLLVLSGDIHKNASPPPIPPEADWGPRSLWEATSSGAAVNFNPFGKPVPGGDILGSFTERFGLLEITQSGIEVRFYAHGAADKQDTTDGGYRIPASFSGSPLPLSVP